jgi:beta-glucosidase
MKHALLALSVLALVNPLISTPRWDWTTINTNNVSFPKDFLWGAGSAAQQVEGGCTNNSWYQAEQEGKCEEKTGIACDHWNRYKEDIRLLKNAGLNTYRFSVEWSKIEPREGIFDETVLQHYQDVIDELKAQGITPCITLHHYTDPIWFADKGGFEKVENIAYFVHFAQTVIDRLQPHGVQLWCTFNSADGYAARGYQQGSQPPFKKNMALMAEVYKNVLEAHVRTYRLIKPRYKNRIKLGILKNIMQFDPYHFYNPFDHLVCKIATDLIDTCFYTFFTSGRFNIWIPFKVNCHYRNPYAIGALDFIGLNYYSHLYIKNFKPIFGKEEVTQNPNYTVYPQGLYRALATLNKKIAKPLTIPIYVTENGIATDDDEQRDRFLKRSLFALSEAIKDRVPVKGYMYWSLLDNYEWGNYKRHYGIYAVNRDTQERTLKSGTAYLTTCALKTNA